jgi:histidinol phosphatase-like enzyme
VGIHQVDLIRAVFLDRDGVLNRNVLNPETGEFESPGKASDLELFPWVLQSLLLLQDAGYLYFSFRTNRTTQKGKVRSMSFTAYTRRSPNHWVMLA